MDVVFLIGRILFAMIFVNSGLFGHLIGRKDTAAYARQSGAPSPELTVPLSGLAILAGGLMVMLGIWGDLGALILAANALVFALVIHPFWKSTDPQEKQNQMAHFFKNIALIGAALVLFYVWNQLQGSAGLSITDPLFGYSD